MGTFQHVPELAIAGTVVKLVTVTDGRPTGSLCRQQDFDREIDLGCAGREGFDDGFHL